MIRFLFGWILVFVIPVTLQAQHSIEAKPQKGEGVYAFLNRHGLNPGEFANEFYKMNQGKFGKNLSLLAHKTYLLPGNALSVTEPLYGKTLSKVEYVSNNMQGAVFYLVSGHGGPDPGAIGTYGGKKLYEDEYAYDITLRLARKLQENGARVHIIIQDKNDGIRSQEILNPGSAETCMGAAIPLDQRQRLKQRARKINELNKKETATYKRCVTIHVDSRSKGKKVDVFFYHHPKSKTGKACATTLRDVMKQKYHRVNPNRGFEGTVSSRNLYMLRVPVPPAVFIELGNIQNYRDQLRVVKSNNRQALANWLYDGLKKDFDICFTAFN